LNKYVNFNLKLCFEIKDFNLNMWGKGKNNDKRGGDFENVLEK